MATLNIGDRVSFIPDGRTGTVLSFNSKAEGRYVIAWDDNGTASGIHISFLRPESEEITKLQLNNGTYEEPDALDNLII